MSFETNWLRPRVFAASLIGWACYWVALFLVGLFGVYVDGVALPFGSGRVLLHLACQAVPFGIATPVLLDLGERFAATRPGRGALWRRLATWALLFSTAHAACNLVSIGWHSGSWGVVLTGALSWGVPYGGIAAVAVALGQRRVAEATERELLTAQLQTLRGQLQPHFLFNTLQGIAATARRDPDTAVRMIALLGDLLRQTLRERDGELVTLAEERALLQPYLDLQQLRFGDRLTVEVDLPDDVLVARVPDLLLQPLVENALLHGIERRPGAGALRIRARRRGARLELQVADDGAGPAVDGATDGLGLGATRQRLRTLFGDAAELELAPGSVYGTVATVSLPWREEARAA